MKQMIALIAATFLSVSAFADVDGSATLDMPNFNASYQAERTGDTIEGSLRGLGNSYGSIKLEKSDIGWNGHLGTYVVRTRSVGQTDNGKTRIEISVLPSGFHTFYVERKDDGTIDVFGRLGGNWAVNASFDGERYEVGTNWFHTAATRNAEAPSVLSGYANLLYQGRWYSSSSHLETNASLDMGAVAEEDPVLWTIMYVIPYFLYR